MATDTGRVRGVSRAQAAIKRFGEKATGKLRKEVSRSVIRMQSDAKNNIAVDTGQARDSVRTDLRESGLSGFVGSSVKHARYLEDGTKPHEIVPVRAKALSWKPRGGSVEHLVAVANVSGKRVFTMRVHHPGTKARPWLRPAFEKDRPKFLRAIPKAVRKAIRESEIRT